MLPQPKEQGVDERRRFERVSLPRDIRAAVHSPDGKRLGNLRMLGRGGFQLETSERFVMGDSGRFLIVDEEEGIKREVRAVVRNLAAGGLVGFEFRSLDAEAAVEIGVIIGKYHSAAHGRVAE